MTHGAHSDEDLVSGFGGLLTDGRVDARTAHPQMSPVATPASGPARDARTPRWGAEALWRRLSGWLPGLTVEVVARSASTNSELIERVRAGRGRPLSEDTPAPTAARRFGRRQDDLQPVLLVAERQTAGRGRRGKSWYAAPGASLTFSLMLPYAPRDWSGLSLAVGLALAEALDPRRSGLPALLIKWPNDLLLRDTPCVGRKLGGILIETVSAGDRRLVVVGVGLNLRAQTLPESRWGFASLDELHPGIDGPRALAVVAPALAAALAAFEREGFAPLRERFAQRDALAGWPLVTTLDDVPAGIGDGVDAQGRLWLRLPDGARRPIVGGEVSLGRAVDADVDTDVWPRGAAGGVGGGGAAGVRVGDDGGDDGPAAR